MRKSTIKYAKALLTPTQYKAWQSMSPRLSKSELESGKRPYGRATKKSTKLSPARKRTTTAKKRKVTPAVARGKAQHKRLMKVLNKPKKRVPDYVKAEDMIALTWYKRRTGVTLRGNDRIDFLGMYRVFREDQHVEASRLAALAEMTSMYL